MGRTRICDGGCPSKEIREKPPVQHPLGVRPECRVRTEWNYFSPSFLVLTTRTVFLSSFVKFATFTLIFPDLCFLPFITQPRSPKAAGLRLPIVQVQNTPLPHHQPVANHPLPIGYVRRAAFGHGFYTSAEDKLTTLVKSCHGFEHLRIKGWLGSIVNRNGARPVRLPAQNEVIMDVNDPHYDFMQEITDEQFTRLRNFLEKPQHDGHFVVVWKLS